ncbi:MAG: hypothetical protein ABJC10_03420 [Acidobacteriota bacterium]
MKFLGIPLVVLIASLMISSASLATPVSRPLASQDQGTQTGQATALERGYRTGYSDGFSSGSQDLADHFARDFSNKEDYQKGDRAYNEGWGTIEDYRDGYQQGFQVGYNAGYDRRAFESSIPSGLSRRGTTEAGTTNPSPNTSQADSGQTTNGQISGPATAPPTAPLVIPRDSILLLELDSSLSTDASQRGDRFTARVIEPREFAGATVEGRVTRVKRAGKLKGTAELQLSFESIHMPDGRTTGLNAEVVELIDNGHRDDSGTVDSEGGVKGRSSTKDDVSKVGASTGIGAIIGAVVGGGKGAAIGAAIGAGVGTGSVLSSRNHDVRIERGQQMKIRTATETRLQ